MAFGERLIQFKNNADDQEWVLWIPIRSKNNFPPPIIKKNTAPGVARGGGGVKGEMLGMCGGRGGGSQG